MYEQVKANKKGSLTSFIVEAVEEKLAREKEADLARGFASLASDLDEDLSPWIDLQMEAMRHVDD